MYLEYPLEALARRRGEVDQLEFARAARRVLPNTGEAVFAQVEGGLAILAANEAALEEPKRMLQELYGEGVEVRDPRARHIPGTPPREPIMQIRITAQREHAPALVAELRGRGACILDQSFHSRLYVVRSEAPLAALLGLPARIDRITGGVGTHWIRLVRYAQAGAGPRD